MKDPADTEVSGRSLLLGGARRIRGRLALLVTLMVVRTGAGLTVPTLLAASVDTLLRGDGAAAPALLWASAVAAGALLDILMVPLAAVSGSGTTYWLRLRGIRHLLALGGRSSPPTGESVTHLTQAAPQAGALPVALVSWCVGIGGSLAAYAALWAVDWQTGLVFTVAVPVTVLLTKTFLGRAVHTHDAYLTAQAGLANRLLTALTGARTIRVSGTLESEITRVLEPLPEVAAAGRRMWGLQKGVVWQLGLLISLTSVAALAVAGMGVAQGRLSPGELLAVQGYLGMAFQGLQRVDGLYGLAQARSAAGRIAAVLNRPAPRYGKRTAPGGPGAVSLRAVTVRRGAEVVLDGLDLEIPGGSVVALVGRTGAGKSVLAGLPGRLTEPDEGEVLLDGVPVRELSRDGLRDSVTYAFQRPELVGGTIGEAIAYGRPGLTGSVVRRATEAAHAAPFVTRLPQGYDTLLVDAPMSGGERQRLGLARTLARSARVYVLDDATSGLDTVTEAKVSEAVTGALVGRTRLVVAHRAATAARCDLVAWLADGRIRALAPHAVLWRDPAYRAVFGRAGHTAGGAAAVDGAVPAGDEKEAACPVRP
ncbi:ABC transporter ATP-binding protein [Streptomyces sp. TP-A0874]|uniref:ABC transporter ATP-binding protein n=1 Tax=Streptomyces sp. TP-A0874 TaxID=549819 RepID=UPI0008532A88|nr:ABC transporter ATP-binding protein [Streptomyces sp. TP-A0874]